MSIKHHAPGTQRRCEMAWLAFNDRPRRCQRRHHPRKRMIQYSMTPRLYLLAWDCWMPAFAGMTAVYAREDVLRMKRPLPLPLAAHKIEIAAFVGLQDGYVEQVRVAAPGPSRRRGGRQRRAPLFQLSGVDQEGDA